MSARDELFNFGTPSVNADGQDIDETLIPVNIHEEPRTVEVSGNVANDQATKDPVMSTTFSSHPSIKTFDPNDINLNFDEAEDAEDIDDEDCEGLEDDDNDRTTQDSNNQAQEA